MSDWQIERITETPQGLRVDFHNDRTTHRVSGFFVKWSEPQHLGEPFTHAAQARKPRRMGPQCGCPEHAMCPGGARENWRVIGETCGHCGNAYHGGPDVSAPSKEEPK